MFTDAQQIELRAKLDADHIRTRKQGTTVSYIEGHTVIDHANAIFGFGNWEGTVVDLTQVECVEIKNDNGKSGWYIGYLARYRVTVWNTDHTQSVHFDDVGYGSDTNYQHIGAGIESATKEAVTDAMKRSLRNFGNQFGLALYDKEQRNVRRGFNPDDARLAIMALPDATVADCRAALATDTYEVLQDLYRTIKARSNSTQPQMATSETSST